MPNSKGEKSFDDLKKEEQEKLITFFENKDAEGLYSYIEDAVTKHNTDWLAGKTNQAFTDSPTGTALQTMMNTLSKTEAPDEKAFLEALMKTNSKKQAAMIVDVGLKYEDVKAQIANTKVDGMEMISSEPKKIEPNPNELLVEYSNARASQKQIENRTHSVKAPQIKQDNPKLGSAKK